MAKIFVRTPLDNLATFKYQDLVSASNRREPVRNNKSCSPTPQGTQSILNQRFAFAVQTRRRLVKNQQFGIGENSARDRNALTLTTG